MTLYTSFRSVLAAAALTLVAATGASAITVNFNSLQSGENLGAVTLATLDAVQDGTDVKFTLTNTVPAPSPTTSFITQLLLNYTGLPFPSAGSNVSGKATNGFAFNSGGFTNAGLSFNIEVSWPTSNSGGGVNRLKVGDQSVFTIANTTLANFDFGEDKSMIHVQGLSNGQSTKYTGTTTVVPVPAAALLLLSGLGGLGALRASRRKS